MQRVLIITDALTSPLYTPRVRYLCHVLHQKGVEVELFAEKSEKVPFDFPYVFNEIAYYRGGKVDWIIKNFLNLFCDLKNRYVAKRIERAVENRDYDIIVCSTFHNFGMRAANNIAKQKGIPWHLDLRDIAEQTMNNEYSNKLARSVPFLSKLYRNINVRRRNKLIAKANSVTSVSEWHVAFLKHINPNVHLVYNGYDEGLFLKNHQRSNTFDIIYAGKWYGQSMQDPCLVFAALQSVKDSLNNARFVWYTDQSIHSKLSELAEEYGVGAIVELRTYVKNKDVNEQLNASSIVLVLTAKNTNGILTTKFFEALGVGKPVLCVETNSGVLYDKINELNCGVATDNIDDVKHFILAKYKQWSECGNTTSSADDEEVKKYSRKAQTEIFLELLEKQIQDKTCCRY